MHYAESKGGRRREDGKVLEWVISSTAEGLRGALPFFCGDVTPREWRVSLPDLRVRVGQSQGTATEAFAGASGTALKH